MEIEREELANCDIGGMQTQRENDVCCNWLAKWQGRD